MNDPKNALARLRDKTERMLGVSEQERSDAQALITLFDSDGVEIDTLKARVAELEADIEVGRETCRRHGTAPENIDDADKWPASRLIGLLSHSLAGRRAAVDDAMALATTARARVAELEAQVRAKEDYALRMDALAEERLSRATKAEARSAELGASAVVSVVQITTDATSLPQVGERVATLSAQYGVSTKQPPDRLLVELLNAVDETAVVALDHARKYLIERDEARARVAQLEAQAERLAKMYARALGRESEAARAEQDAAARYDCKGGPGTTAPACGGCVTCLHRVIEAGEVRAKRAEAQVAAVRTVALNTLALGDDDVRPDDILRALNEVKDEAKTPEPVEKVFDIYSFGLFYMSVCTNMSPAEAELHARKNNPSGTQNGWRIAQETFQSGEPNPCPCDRNPDRIHILFQC